MPNVLIREVPENDLDQLRSAAARQGSSLQSYLLDAVRAQAAYLRRQAALARVAERLSDQARVPDSERSAVLDAIAEAHGERSEQLSGPRHP